MLLVLSFQISFTVGQDFIDDPEIVDIRVRISEVTWDLTEYQSTLQNGTFINFNISLELWNPYDEELVSHGSSSCRWLSQIEFSLIDSYETENSGEACTEDYGPRAFPSGLSTETSIPSILILDSIVTTIPDGTFLISDFRGFFGNQSDNSYGLNLTTFSGLGTEMFESIPLDWGEILFSKQDFSDTTSSGSLGFNLITSISLVLLIPIYRRRLFA